MRIKWVSKEKKEGEAKVEEKADGAEKVEEKAEGETVAAAGAAE